MRPLLYSELTLSGGSYGKRLIGVLNRCTKCKVRETRAGVYTLSMETTVNEEFASQLLSQRIIGIKPNPFDSIQLFEIQKTGRKGNRITAEAKHVKNLCFQFCSEGDVSYEGEEEYFNGTPLEVWNEIITNRVSGGRVPFTFTSDITTKADFYLGLAQAEKLGNILGGKEGSFTDMWSGEYHWDNFNISFLRSRGSVKSYRLRYGQNISSADQTESCEATYSHILPYGYVAYGGKRIHLTAPRYAIPGSQSVYEKTFMLDCTEALSGYEISTVPPDYTAARAAMTAYAQTYAQTNALGEISAGIKVDLRAALDDMKQLGLCDTITVILDNFGTQAKAKITDVTYDALLERWDKIVIGNPTIEMADLILNKRRFIQ